VQNREHRGSFFFRMPACIAPISFETNGDNGSIDQSIVGPMGSVGFMNGRHGMAWHGTM